MEGLSGTYSKVFREIKARKQRTTPQEAIDIRAALDRERHFRNCLRCRRERPLYPCSDSPTYQYEMARIRAGLAPLEQTPALRLLEFLPRLETEDPSRSSIAALEGARGFAVKPQGWLVLVGQVGTGKTHLAQGIAETRIAVAFDGHEAACGYCSGRDKTTFPCRGFVTGVRYSRVAALLDEWRGLLRDAPREGDDPFWLDFNSWCASRLVVLDDLGAERPTAWARERLTMLLDHRYGRRLPTVVTTNLSREQLSNLWDTDRQDTYGRIADRLYDTGSGLCVIRVLDYASYRTGRRW